MFKDPRKRGGALHHQLYIHLRQAIVAGHLAPGAGLPGENVLAETHAISRVTVRRALERLEFDGLVERVQGAGTFVADVIRPIAITADLDDHFEHVTWLAQNTQVTVLRHETIAASASVAAAMDLAAGDSVAHLQRVRSHRGTPFLYLDTFLPSWVAQRIDWQALEGDSLHFALREAGFVFGAAEHIATAVAADQALADALQVPFAAPLLLTRWVERDPSGRVLQSHLNYARPDLYVVRTRFATGPKTELPVRRPRRAKPIADTSRQGT